MRMRIAAFAERMGVSVRTLRYYDAIGLLRPAGVDPNSGYRLYDEANAARLSEILFYRELEFPLETIRRILDAPHYDRRAAMERQRALLLLKKERLEQLLRLLDDTKEENMKKMRETERQYEAQRSAFEREAAERWGGTEAYRAFVERTPGRNDAAAQAEMEAIFDAFGAAAARKADPSDEAVQTLVGRLQACITKHFYPCTDAILKGLGQMYVSDARFQTNLDAHGAGTAVLMRDAIAALLGE